jgi:hypothetical protein
MIDPREKLRLLYFASIMQPVAIRELWDMYVKAGRDGSNFSELLKMLRAEGYLSDSDPVSVTDEGQSIIQRYPLQKGRDIARMFRLKNWATHDSVGGTGGG